MCARGQGHGGAPRKREFGDAGFLAACWDGGAAEARELRRAAEAQEREGSRGAQRGGSWGTGLAGGAYRKCISFKFIAFILVLVAAAVLLALYSNKKPHYYGAIAAASPTPPGEFTLAFGVESGSPFSSECFEPGMAATVVVSGSGNMIAAGNVSDMACAPRWRPEEKVMTNVFAMGVGDGGALAAMAEAGKQFDLLLRIPDGGSSKLVVCRGRRIGEPLAPCDAPTKN